MLSLPDEALLAVLANLPLRDLFRCRVVCRRLRDLCLHRVLWKHAEVSDLGVLRAALNLAPCLGEISCTSLEDLAYLVQDTACVVHELDFTITSQSDAALATAIIARLSPVGGLFKISILIRCPSSTPTLPTLLRAVLNIPALQDLMVVNNLNPEQLPVPLVDREVREGLTKLTYVSRLVEPYLDLLLRTHAASLEEVFLYRMTEPPMSLLAKIPRLRLLQCHPTDGLAQLVDLRNLEEVRLTNCTSDDGAWAPGALHFFQTAAQLRTVEFISPTKGSSAAYLVALAESPSARQVETLVGVTGIPGVLELVAPVLCKFPSLRRISVETVPPNDLLRAISPTSLPSLTTLSLRSPPGICAHEWVHGPAIQDVLARNPRLHLLQCGLPNVPLDCACVWCGWGCHGGLRGHWTYSSHSRKTGCPADCFQVVNCSPSLLSS